MVLLFTHISCGCHTRRLDDLTFIYVSYLSKFLVDPTAFFLQGSYCVLRNAAWYYLHGGTSFCCCNSCATWIVGWIRLNDLQYYSTLVPCSL
jgi:hypothetical protein